MTKLWLISQSTNNSYDTYDSAVVAADTEEEARMINPGGYDDWSSPWNSWCKRPEDVEVEFLGTTERELSGVVLSSFNAG